MKPFLNFLPLIILLSYPFGGIEAQKVNYSTNGGMIIGFGMGASSQKSDIDNSRGYGFDFTLGHYFYKKESAFLSADWKFHFLRGENRAHDHRINLDGTYSNIRYDFFNYDLELGLTLNRLRERTRIVVSGYAGAGITHGRTFTDLYDEDNNLYDYSVINTNQEPEKINADLLELSDRDYETRLDNKGAILPTLGFFIGYQFSHSFSMGIEHKINFSLSESNSIKGINIDNNIASGSGIDRNRFTTLGFKWSLGGRSTGGAVPATVATTVPPPAPAITPITSYKMPRPDVNILNPSENPFNTNMYTYIIRAKVYDVEGYNNISFYQDGNKNDNFEFYPAMNNFKASVTLHEGDNTFRIVATNTTGSAEDNVTIIVKKTTKSNYPPFVDITTPPGNTHSTTDNHLDISAHVENVKNKQDIQVVFNDQNINFDFYPGSGNVQSSITLSEGVNKLVVKGMNETGTAIDNVTIIFNRPTAQTTSPLVKITTPPSVKFTNPPSPVTVQQNQFSVSAQTMHVPAKQNVTVKINGTSTGNFTFSTNGVISSDVPLTEGTNTIEITGKNEFGVTSDITTIIYKKPVTAIPPSITILVPGENPYRTFENTEQLTAKVLNVKSKENITLNINGNITSNFTFNNSALILNTSVPLTEGQNVVTITARNEAGQDVKSQVITKEIKVIDKTEIPCNPPVVTLISSSSGSVENSQYIFQAQVNYITHRNQLTLIVNGNTALFDYTNNVVIYKATLNPGVNNIVLTANTKCGTDSKTASIVYVQPIIEEKPCLSPMVNFNVTEVNREDASHILTGTVANVKNTSEIILTVNGKPDNGFQFVPATGELAAKFKLQPGTFTFVVTAKNECGQDTKKSSVTVATPPTEEKPPCVPPVVSFNITPVDQTDASHEMKGTVTQVKNKSDITFTINGQPDNSFQFVPATGELAAKFKLQPGTFTFVVTAKNECGQDTKTNSVTVATPPTEEKPPCVPPVVSFNITPVDRTDASHEMKGTVTQVKNKSDITFTVNGQPDNSFQFVPATGELTAKFNLQPGTFKFVVTAKNECGQESKTISVVVKEPCVPPVVNFTLTEVNREDASHELTGTIANVKNTSDITMTVNGKPDNSFQFVSNTQALSAKFKLQPGTHVFIVTAKNECGQDSKSFTIIVEEKACGPRINPGNSDWQFCLVTPGGTYNRNNLANSNFSYSGPASSLYFMPIAGGGDAIVNGKPYSLRPGQYYLFTGKMTVTVSTKNPGSMGHWSVCVTTDKAPESGSGNNRPKSPCEAEQDDDNAGDKEKKQDEQEIVNPDNEKSNQGGKGKN